MKYVNKTISGLMYIAFAGALSVGLIFVMDLLFIADIPLFGRILAITLAVLAFINGFIAEGGGESGEEDAE